MGKSEEGVRKLSKGMIQLLNAYRAYGRMLMHLDRIIDDDLKSTFGPTVAGVNARKLLWNPVMAADMSMPQIRAVLLHETFHLVLQHLGRVKQRHPALWNYVADKKCNQYAKEIEDARVPLDVSGFILPASDELEMTTEELYKKYYDEADKVTVSYVGPDMPIDESTGNTSDVETQMWENRIRDLLKKEAGKLPAGLRRELDELLNPVVPWQQVLREYASEAVKGMNEFTWKKFNQMWRMYGVYYPGMKGDKVNVYFAADTSGSMGTEELRAVFTEAKGVLDIYGEVYFMSCDAAIHESKKIENIEELIKAAKGGGGTDFRPVFTHVDQMYHTEDIPPILVYATDGYGTFPDYEPQYPTIWLMIHTTVEPPWGKAIYIE